MALVKINVLSEFKQIASSAPLSFTSSAFTPPANSLLVVHIGSTTLPGVDPTNGWLLTGGSLTWTRRKGPNSATISGYYGVHEIWTAPVNTPASMTLTYANAGKTQGADIAYTLSNIHAYTGYNKTSPIGTSATGTGLGDDAASITLSAAPDSDSIVTASRFFNANASDPSATPGAGWTEVYDLVSGGGYGALESEDRTGSNSTSVAWVDTADGGATSWGNSGLAIEIKNNNTPSNLRYTVTKSLRPRPFAPGLAR